jgi:hypothetical protein
VQNGQKFRPARSRTDARRADQFDRNGSAALACEPGMRAIHHLLPLRAILLLTLLGGLAIASTSCGDDENKSPTTPTGIPTISGSWAGTYHIKTCTDTVNGAAGTLCATVLDTTTTTNTASTQPVQVVLTQQNDQVGGTVTFSGWYVQTVPVTGTVGSSGRIWLQGTVAFSDTACPAVTGTVSLSGWVTDLNREQNEAIGVFNLTGLRKMSACLFANISVTADSVDIKKK